MQPEPDFFLDVVRSVEVDAEYEGGPPKDPDRLKLIDGNIDSEMLVYLDEATGQTYAVTNLFRNQPRRLRILGLQRRVAEYEQQARQALAGTRAKDVERYLSASESLQKLIEDLQTELGIIKAQVEAESPRKVSGA